MRPGRPGVQRTAQRIVHPRDDRAIVSRRPPVPRTRRCARAFHARARRRAAGARPGAGTRTRNALRPRHPHARRGGGTRLPRGRHAARRRDPLHGGARRRGPRPDASHAVRGELGGPAARRPRHRLAGAHGAARRGEGGDRAARRPARPLRCGGRGVVGRTPGRHRPHARDPRRRDQFQRRRDGRGLPSARGDRGSRRRPHPLGVARPHRPHGEPGRAEPLRVPELGRGGALAGRGPDLRRARPAVAGRPREPLPVRPQPGPVHPEPGRNAGEGGHFPRVPSPHRGGPARDGRGRDLLLPPHRAALQPLVRGAAGRAHGRVRRGDRGALRRTRVRVLQPGRVRPLLSRLRGHVADGARGAGDDVRAGGRRGTPAAAIG